MAVNVECIVEFYSQDLAEEYKRKAFCVGLMLSS